MDGSLTDLCRVLLRSFGVNRRFVPKPFTVEPCCDPEPKLCVVKILLLLCSVVIPFVQRSQPVSMSNCPTSYVTRWNKLRERDRPVDRQLQETSHRPRRIVISSVGNDVRINNISIVVHQQTQPETLQQNFHIYYSSQITPNVAFTVAAAVSRSRQNVDTAMTNSCPSGAM